MGIIHQLHRDLINKIAAGEVIESPHSLLKELLENSLDAGATQLWIETKVAGLDYLMVRDNGSGILSEDIPLAFQRHATSKIQNFSDLESVLSYGFRGEALASIASVSRMTLETGTEGQSSSTKIQIQGESLSDPEPIPHFRGTKMEIRDLFYNTPVRRKFLKSELAEDKKNKTRVILTALAREDVSFLYKSNGKEIFRLQPESKKERIVSLFGESIRNHLMEVSLEENGIQAVGFISDPDYYRSNRNGQFFFVNNRPVELKNASYLLKKCYDELLPPGAHPWCFLFFSLDPHRIDVNVHPQKKEIRFVDEEGFQNFFFRLIQKELRSSTPIDFVQLRKRLNLPEYGRFSPKNSANSPTWQTFFSEGSNPNRESPAPTSSEPPLLSSDILDNSISHEEGFSLGNTGPGIQLDELTDEPRKHSEFVPLKHHGVIFETFILAEALDGFYIIDQHTAHERIRYEEVLRSLQKKNYGIQTLLTPIRLDLSLPQAEDILNKYADLKALGFFVEDLGGGTVLVTEVPAYLEPGKEKEVLVDFLDRMSSISHPEPYDLMAKCVSCRSAVKKGDLLSPNLISELLNRLSYCENPSRCPHGRPTLIKLTRFDLERMFHRR